MDLDLVNDPGPVVKQFNCFWSKCQYSTKNIKHLKLHRFNHLNKRQFVCDFNECKKTFVLKQQLIQHKRIHSNDKQFKCDFNDCNQSFIFFNNLCEHKRLAHFVTIYRCDWKDCKQIFVKKSSLNSHKISIHSGKHISNVSECKKTFNTKQHQNNNKRHPFHLGHSQFGTRRVNNFVCYKCFKKFQSKRGLIQHKLIHSKEKQLKCDLNDCNKSFKFINNLKEHQQSYHSNIAHPCVWKECTKVLINKHKFDLHMKSVHNRYVCDWSECKKTFIRKYSLLNHKRTHTVPRPFKCDIIGCTRAYSRISSLNYHQESIHSHKSYRNDSNKTTFSTKQYLNNYKKFLNKKQIKYQCDVEGCGKAFPDNQGLIQHKNSHTIKTPFFCNTKGCKHFLNNKFKCGWNECGKIFCNQDQLNKHEYVDHENQFKYQCDDEGCGKAFIDNQGLIRHKLEHSLNKTFKCNINGCVDEYPSFDSLKIHQEANHNGLKCGWIGCDRKFSNEAYLNEHENFEHKNLIKYLCDVEGCGEASFNKQALINHQGTHSVKNTFYCNKNGCKQAFTTYNSLKDHQDVIHWF